MQLAYENLTKITPFYCGVFSNWYRSGDFYYYFLLQPHTYNVVNCAEQGMMLSKAELFKDYETYDKIRQAKHPREQKALGRTVKGFDQAKWNAVARHIMFSICYQKFLQVGIQDDLFKTRGTLLVEASPTDCIWGVGLAEDNQDIYDKSKWRGTNWLGEVLTDVRISMIGA